MRPNEWVVVAALVIASACSSKTKDNAPGSGSGSGLGSESMITGGSGSGSGSGSGGSSSLALPGGSDSGSARPPMPAVANAGPGFLHVKGADYEGVIASAGGPWTPSPQDIADVEAVLGPAIAAHELGRAFPAATFKREYSGGQDGATRLISIQLACEVDADWPQRGLPAVKGGGACYGTADYDVATGRLTRLAANSRR